MKLPMGRETWKQIWQASSEHMVVVSNSTPLIYLAKIGKLDLLKKLFGKIIMPKAVYEETVVRGLEKGFSDARVIDDGLRDGWMVVRETKPSDKLIRFAPELDDGEIEALALAEQVKAELVLIDDAAARAIAESIGLRPKGTVFVLLLATKRRFVSKREAKSMFVDLIESGFRLAPDIYARILRELEENE